MAIFIDEAQVTELLDMASCIDVLERAFKDKAEGEASNLPRRRLPFRGARFMIMASTMSRQGWYGHKVYGVGRGHEIVLYSHFSSPGSVSGLIASTGHSGTQTPQSMHSSRWMTSMFSPS